VSHVHFKNQDKRSLKLEMCFLVGFTAERNRSCLSFKRSVDYHCEVGPEDFRLYTEEYNTHVAAKAGEGIVPVFYLTEMTIYVALKTQMPSPLKLRHRPTEI